MSGMVLTPRPPLQHLERGWIPAFAGMTGGAGTNNPGFRLSPPYDGAAGDRPGVRASPPMVPPLRRGDGRNMLRPYGVGDRCAQDYPPTASGLGVPLATGRQLVYCSGSGRERETTRR